MLFALETNGIPTSQESYGPTTTLPNIQLASFLLLKWIANLQQKQPYSHQNHCKKGWWLPTAAVLTFLCLWACNWDYQRGLKEIQAPVWQEKLTPQLQKGDWVLVRFPHDKIGKSRKLSQPWHGPYRVVDVNYLDLTVSKVYFGVIQIRQTRVRVF